MWQTVPFITRATKWIREGAREWRQGAGPVSAVLVLQLGFRWLYLAFLYYKHPAKALCSPKQRLCYLLIKILQKR